VPAGAAVDGAPVTAAVPAAAVPVDFKAHAAERKAAMQSLGALLDSNGAISRPEHVGKRGGVGWAGGRPAGRLLA
jgi:hypothetical protein